MSGFWYGAALQWKLDIRSRTLLITCYVVPLIFFALMGAIFTTVNPEMKYTLIQSMTIMGVSMGALIGLPPSLVEIYGSDIKKAYKANGVPLYLGMASTFLSAFIHLMIMSTIICIAAPIAFDASLPSNLPLYYVSLAIFTMVSLSVGCVLGLAVKNQAKLTMFSQLVFLPSIMLSGIMFPINLLPKAVETVGKLFPASWGFKIMVDNGFQFENLWCLLLVFIAATILCFFMLKRHKSE